MYLAKDYVETFQGLIFAVVAKSMEAGKVRGFLRYIHQQGQWCKVDSDTANQYLAQHAPEYLFHSSALDAELHGIAQAQITRHYAAKPGLKSLLQNPAQDAVQADLQQLCSFLRDAGMDFQYLGLTGSLLLGLQNPDSDIDLLCDNREAFQQLRSILQKLLAEGKCQALAFADWQAAYQRRGCDLSLEEYIWHEQRKYNKALINQRKFDISLVAAQDTDQAQAVRKLGKLCIEAPVSDALRAFDYPAEYSVVHNQVDAVLSFTATYLGQAETGETLLAAGQLEIDANGKKYLVIGSNREARGEFIKVKR